MARTTALLLSLAACRVASARQIEGGVAVSDAPPPTPVWPNAWAAYFAEHTTGRVNMTGMWYYDWTNKRERTDRCVQRTKICKPFWAVTLIFSFYCRTRGDLDRFCVSQRRDQAPCTHLVTGGMRYLVWPTLNFCCSCCDDSQGCGVLM
jgi:hypothetical protein